MNSSNKTIEANMSSTAFWLQAIAYTIFLIVIVGQYRGWF